MNWVELLITIYGASFIFMIIRFLISKRKEANFSWIVMPFLIVFSPIVTVIGIFIMVRNRYYQNRPEPLSKKKLRFLKKDRVFDHKNGIVSITEYNRKHCTSFSLSDTFCKSQPFRCAFQSFS